VALHEHNFGAENAMLLVRQPKTAGFRPNSRYEYIIHWLSRCYEIQAW